LLSGWERSWKRRFRQPFGTPAYHVGGVCCDARAKSGRSFGSSSFFPGAAAEVARLAGPMSTRRGVLRREPIPTPSATANSALLIGPRSQLTAIGHAHPDHRKPKALPADRGAPLRLDLLGRVRQRGAIPIGARACHPSTGVSRPSVRPVAVTDPANGGASTRRTGRFTSPSPGGQMTRSQKTPQISVNPANLDGMATMAAPSSQIGQTT
jgi:hypothetical protein